MPDESPNPHPVSTPETGPLVEALNKLTQGIDERNKAALEAQNKILADAMQKQAEAIQGIFNKQISPIPATPPASQSKQVDVGPIIQRIFSDSTFRDRVVALHTSFPTSG